MELERRLRKVSRYHLALFILPMVSLFYYGWWCAGELNQRPDNPWRLSPLGRRGEILDRRSQPLAVSQQSVRWYPLRAAAGPLIGYHLRGRNQSGLEAALQVALSPPPPPKSLWGAVEMDRERQPGQGILQGPSVRVTLDAQLQEELYQLFQPRIGAVVVGDINSGDILAAISSPSFDPQEIARDWQSLRNDPRSPLIERVGSGLYPVQSWSGEPLLTSSQKLDHPWFASNPFPNFPGSSSALEIDARVFYSPLMLWQIAAQRPGGASLAQPKLVPNSEETSTEPSAPSPAQMPDPGAAEKVGHLEVYRLRGPRFQESPPFEVVLGRQIGAGGLAFAIVVEQAAPNEYESLRTHLLPLISNWQGAVARPEAGSAP